MLLGTTTTLYKIYFYAVAGIRKESGSTSIGFVILIIETFVTFLMMLAIMMLMRSMMGSAGSIRGPFGFYVFIGVSLFMMHVKMLGSVFSKPPKDSMSAVLAISQSVKILGDILNTVYMMTIVNILFYAILVAYYQSTVIDNWTGFLICYFGNILWVCCIGIWSLALRGLWRWGATKLLMLYRRAAIITSGKMIPGNYIWISGRFGGLFLINPLFHYIDQARGFAFQHYNPYVSSLSFPIQATAIGLCVGVIGYAIFKDKM